MEISFCVSTRFDDLVRAFAVRAIVFCEGQFIAYDVEHDEHDFSCVHVLGEVDREPVAAGRIRFVDGIAKLERIAVREKYRGHGFGHALTDFMIEVAAQRGFGTCKVHAQTYLREFYAEHGFKAEGEVFEEAGIKHVAMVRRPAQHGSQAQKLLRSLGAHRSGREGDTRP